MARWIVGMDFVSSAGPYDVLMPMQPRPIAETSRPCLPSFRFSRLIDLLLCFGTCGWGYFLKTSFGLILFVADLFHPVGGLAVELFLDGDVSHGRGWRGTVPMFPPRREPDHVPRPDFLDRPPALDPDAASRHDQGLAKPGGCASAGLECDTGAAHACWIGCLEQGV